MHLPLPDVEPYAPVGATTKLTVMALLGATGDGGDGGFADARLGLSVESATKDKETRGKLK